MKRFNGMDWMFVITVLILVGCLAGTFYLTRKEIYECRLTNPMSLLPADCGPKKTPVESPRASPASGTVPGASTIGSQSRQPE